VSKNLVLQILGNSDVQVAANTGSIRFKNCFCYEDMIGQVRLDEKNYKEGKLSIKFPLLKQLLDDTSNDASTICLILTDQTQWIQSQINNSDLWNEISASDGHWWENILIEWCNVESIKLHPVPLKINPVIANGVADWDGMAELLNSILNEEVKIQQQNIVLRKTNESFDKIIIQHSSGTPALSGALYLWGIEQKLSGIEVEFIYLSPEGNSSKSTFHDGNHWQWRLKAPQVLQLIGVQDFSGALELTKNDQSVKEEVTGSLEFLDKSVSLNLKGHKDLEEPRNEVIERISIALWSEKAFREKHHWTQWYMKVAGAFELALLCLVEHRGNLNALGSYSWKKKRSNRTYLEYFHSASSSLKEATKINISNIVKNLLPSGTFKEYEISKLDSSEDWDNFKKFYCHSWISKEGFITLRNSLYHSLAGEEIDELLDEATQRLYSVDHEEHPSRVAINQLNYIIDQAQMREEVDLKVEVYHKKVQEIMREL
jgi:hypothetical protein